MAAEQLEQAQQIARGVLANVSADQLDQATPCAKWDVAQLIDHLVGAQHWARSAMEGGEGGETGEGSAAGDFVATFDDAAARTLAAFREEGALARMVNPGFGDMPAAALLGLSTTDTFTHAWDLARSTGQDTDLDHGPGLPAARGLPRRHPARVPRSGGQHLRPRAAGARGGLTGRPAGRLPRAGGLTEPIGDPARRPQRLASRSRISVRRAASSETAAGSGSSPAARRAAIACMGFTTRKKTIAATETKRMTASITMP